MHGVYDEMNSARDFEILHPCSKIHQSVLLRTVGVVLFGGAVSVEGKIETATFCREEQLGGLT